MESYCLLFISAAFSLTAGAQIDSGIIQTKHTETLIPEGIAVNPTNGNIYVSSIAQQKIIVIKDDGTNADFIQSGEDGFGWGLGLKVDTQRNLLWAISNRQEGKIYMAQLHAFDLAKGKTKMKFIVKDTIRHFMNDVVLDGKGNAYTTATETGEIFIASIKTGNIKLFIRDTLIKYPNGIEFNDDKLYIATYGSGLLIYDILQKKLEQLKGYTSKDYAYNLDGLGFYKSALFGVYNGGESNSENAVVAYKLAESGSRITSEKIIRKGHLLFHEPTTLSITGNKLYVLANSHLAAYNKNKESVKGIEGELTPVTILVYKLKE